MENKTNLPDVPYMVHEDDMARLERTVKRVWILCIILITALIGSNAGWIWYESQFIDEVSVEQDAEWEDGSHIILNGTGEVTIDGQSTSEGN